MDVHSVGFLENWGFGDFQCLKSNPNEPQQPIETSHLAHELPSHLLKSDFGTNQDLLGAAHKAIFKISNYQAYLDIGSDPAFKGIDWSTAKGHEYIILETIIQKAKLLQGKMPAVP